MMTGEQDRPANGGGPPVTGDFIVVNQVAVRTSEHVLMRKRDDPVRTNVQMGHAPFDLLSVALVIARPRRGQDVGVVAEVEQTGEQISMWRLGELKPELTRAGARFL